METGQERAADLAAFMETLNHPALGINFARDGIRFQAVQTELSNIPKAPGLYRPELEDGNANGKSPGWGISMVQKKGLAYLLRFEMKESK